MVAYSSDSAELSKAEPRAVVERDVQQPALDELAWLIDRSLHRGAFHKTIVGYKLPKTQVKTIAPQVSQLVGSKQDCVFGPSFLSPENLNSA